MKRLSSSNRNVYGLLDGRTLDSLQVPYPYQEHNVMRALQMHTCFISRLVREPPLEGHQGCVNALAWNSTGSLLLSGSDDTRVNVWNYSGRKLQHSIDTGHTANIFCTKFLPETGDDVVVSGAGDNEVRVHRLSRSGSSAPDPTAIFRCHTRRVKKLAVEDGNPHVVWSASEDGTLRQHDLRQAVVCPAEGATDQECRNIILDLRGGAKRSLSDPPKNCLSLKTCAINRVRPHHLLVGGSDAFARLYDRRMLSTGSSSQQVSKPPPCVCYYCPAHLSDYSRSSLHLTHVTFSPDGQDVLLSYSGEHVYLMDAYNGHNDSVIYAANDVPKRMALAPVLNGAKLEVPLQSNAGRGYCRMQECVELLEEARKAVEAGNYLHAIDIGSEVIVSGGLTVKDTLLHDVFCVRATAFLKRGWKNDMHMAIRDSNEAREINPMSVEAHHNMSEALSQLGRHKDALEFAMRAYHLDPSDARLSDHVTQLRAKLTAAEEARNSRNDDTESKSERRSSRIRSLRDFFFRSDQYHSDSSEESRRAEREESDNDEDMEMEMEIEMSVVGDDEREREAGVPSSSSLNLRLRRKPDSISRDRRTSPLNISENNSAEIAVDMRQRYVGHCNTGTDIKQASFLGERGEFVASGSDDGRWFIWDKKTGRLLKILVGDETVVNCVQSHPFDCAVATSGIDNTIKIWSPCGESEQVESGIGDDAEGVLRIMGYNQQQMRRHREIGLPLELLQRIRGVEGAVHPFECTQS